MKRVSGALLILVGVLAIAFGFLFLVGAGGRVYRYAIAVGALAAGGVLVGFGLRLHKAAQRQTPAYIRAEILALAKGRNGELSAGDLAAALGERIDLAIATLDQMVDIGFCTKARKDGATYYVFAELQPRLMVRRCEFCKAEIPLSQDVVDCPQCGGSTEQKIERKALSDESYSMDD